MSAKDSGLSAKEHFLEDSLWRAITLMSSLHQSRRQLGGETAEDYMHLKKTCPLGYIVGNVSVMKLWKILILRSLLFHFKSFSTPLF